MEVVRTLQVAKQLDFLGGNNLAGALASLTGGGGKENFHYQPFGVIRIGPQYESEKNWDIPGTKLAQDNAIGPILLLQTQKPLRLFYIL